MKEANMVMLGWKAGIEQYSPADLLEYARAADAAGFDALDVSDHFHPWSEEGQAAFTWTWLGAAAVQTKRIVLGPGVTCPILRYHPAIIAQAAATLSCLAPGRAYLGVGTGEALNEYAAVGEWPTFSERQERLVEAIELIRALWTGEAISHAGEYYRTRKARLYTPPRGPLPLYISTMAPESAAFAGRYGDGMITVGGQEPAVYRQMLQEFEAGARAAGKDPAGTPRLIELNVAYTDDAAGAIACQQQYWAGAFVPALFAQKIYTPAMSAKNGKVVGADTLRQMMCLSAKPEDHVQYARQYLKLGFDQLYFHSAGPDQRAFLEGYGRDVLPRLRGSANGRAQNGNGQAQASTAPRAKVGAARGG